MQANRYILLDMNTQRDFLDTGGSCVVANRQALVPMLRRIFQLARAHHTPVISSLDTHRDSEGPSDFPIHCVQGSTGHSKPAYTLLRKRTLVEANNNLDLPHGLLGSYRQVLFRRRTRDFLENPKADRLISEHKPEMYIVFGVGLERSIKQLILCLLARGHRVGLIPEACGYWNETDADLAVRLFSAKGGHVMTVDECQSMLEESCGRRRPRSAKKSGKRRSLAS